jgi:hypothetical protein
VFVKGKGSELRKTKAMNGRAKTKMITQKRSLKLIDVAGRRGDTERIKQYWRAYRCQSNIITTDGRLHGNRCGLRFCALCCRIRKGHLIEDYGPTIDNFPDPHLVVLTIRALPARKLKWLIDNMYRAINRINAKYYKRRSRGDTIDYRGIRTLECNFNEDKRTYNPHFNLIVPNKEVGEIIKMEWSKLWTRRYVNAEIQYCEPVRSKEKIMLEVIKYGFKTFSEPDMDKKLQNKATAKIYAAALHNILSAMEGHGIFDRFGFTLKKTKSDKPKGRTFKEVSDYIKWKYYPKCFDWVGEDTDGVLTNYSPEPDLLKIVNNRIDVLLE